MKAQTTANNKCLTLSLDVTNPLLNSSLRKSQQIEGLVAKTVPRERRKVPLGAHTWRNCDALYVPSALRSRTQHFLRPSKLVDTGCRDFFGAEERPSTPAVMSTTDRRGDVATAEGARMASPSFHSRERARTDGPIPGPDCGSVLARTSQSPLPLAGEG